MRNNYFSVSRDLLHSDRWLDEPFTRGQAWVDLFGLANHAKGFVRVRGILVTVERGQLAYSQLTLSKRWKWSRNKVRRYLNELEKRGNVKQQNNQVTTLITIVDYSVWQGGTEQQTIQQRDNRKTTDGTQTIRNNKKEKNNTNVETRAQVQRVYDHFISRFNRNPNQYRLTDKRRAKLRSRIADAGEEMLIRAIDNVAGSKFHNGDNDRGWSADLDFIIRSYEQVERLSQMVPTEKQIEYQADW